MSDNKALLRRFYDEVASKGNIDLIDELVAPDVVEHEVFPGLTPDREGVKAFFRMIREAFPDFRLDVEDMVAEGDKVVARATMRGTHQGEFMGVPASGKRIEVPVIDILRFADGKAVEHWGITDGMAMMQQMGALPEQP